MSSDLIPIKKNNFGEMVAYFNRTVADMDIGQKYKMQLLGMITAIEMEHDSKTPKWIPITERMPDTDGHYLTFVKYRDKSTAVKIKLWKGCYFTSENTAVWYWMPLPPDPEDQHGKA